MAPVILRIDVDDRGNPKLVKLNQNIDKMKKKTVSTGEVLKNVFAGAAMLKSLELLRMGISKATQEVFQFEHAIKQIEGVTGVTGSALLRLRNESKELAKSTEFSATSIAKSMLEITKMGFETPQTLEAMPHILNLATASMSDLGYVSENAISVLKAFNMDASETERIANVVSVALNKTSLNFEDYMEAIKFVAPVSKNLHMSFEETTAILGTLADVGLRGSLGGNSLKNMLLNLIEPGDAVAESLSKVDMTGKSLTDILKHLKNAGLSVNDILQTMQKRAIPGALAIGNVAGSVKQLTQDLLDQGTTAEGVAKVIRSSTLSLWEQMNAALGVVGITFQEALGPHIQELLIDVTESVRELDTWVENNQETIGTWGENIKDIIRVLGSFTPVLKLAAENSQILVAAFATWKISSFLKGDLGPLNVGIGTLALKAKTATTAMGTLKLSMGSLMAAMGPVNIALAAAAATVALLDKRIANLDRQSKNVSKDFNSERHLKDLQALKEAREAFEGSSGGRGNRKQAIQELNKLQNEYRKTWGDTAAEMVKTDEALESQLKRVETMVRLEAEKTAEMERQEELARKLREQAEKEAAAYGSQVELLKERERQAKEQREEGVNPYTQIFNGLTNLPVANDAVRNVGEYQSFLSSKNFTGLGGNALLGQDLSILDATDSRDSWVQSMKDTDEEANKIDNDVLATRLEERKAMFSEWISFAENAYSGLSSVMNAVWEARNKKDLEHFNKSKERINQLKSIELAAAGDSAVKKEMVERKYFEMQQDLDRQREKAEAEAKRKEKAWRIAMATADAIAAGVSIFAQQKGNLISKTAAAGMGISLGMGWVASLVSTLANARHGTIVDGDGNGTSDSVPYMLSKGERVLSTQDVAMMGGHQMIDRVIDRGTTYNNSSSVNVTLVNPIGNEEYFRGMIPVIQEELSR